MDIMDLPRLGLIPPETSSRNSRHLLLDREVRQLSPAIEWASVDCTAQSVGYCTVDWLLH